MWTPEHRRAADRRGLRYPSDLTDAEWALIGPSIPPAKRGGRRREVNVREVLNAIFYVLSTGCQWQALPKDLPPKSTAHYYFMLWAGRGRWSASTTRSTWRRASARAARRARRPPSLTAKAPKPLKRGLRARPTRLRCGQEGHRPQEAYPRRHARPPLERRRPSRQRAGS
jgi:transposase